MLSSASDGISTNNTYSKLSKPFPSKASEASLVTIVDVRDHSRLKASWDSLLRKRFLAAQPLAILPLYISSIFIDMQPRPTLQVSLPPNSFAVRSSIRTTTGFGAEADSNGMSSSEDSDGENDAPAPPKGSWFVKTSSMDRTSDFYGLRQAIMRELETSIDTTAPMHLARTVAIVEHCKEAIWVEYQNLYGTLQTYGDNTLHEDFDMYWNNWKK